MSQLLPLSRKGSGPGLIILTPGSESPSDDIVIKNGIPSPLVKWAEESYTVVQIQSSGLKSNPSVVAEAIEALKTCEAVEGNGKYGLVIYDAATFKQFETQFASTPEIAGAVIYSDTTVGTVTTKIPSVQHLAGSKDSKLPRTQQLTVHAYPSAKSSGFALPSSVDFDYALEAISHTRNLTFLKHHTVLAGPIFDLEAIWDEHTYYEFEERNVAKTMATMVQEPYVNHVPTLTGGIGREALTQFYTNNFIFSNPDDAELELISRTIGIDRVVDEFIFKFTHDRTVDWLLPSIPPTGRKAEVPMMAVVNVRGDRLYHEHIAWDQATALRQVGILPEHLSWPSQLDTPDQKYIDASSKSSTGGSERSLLAARIPVAGVEAAMKLRDKNAVKSNEMFAFKMSYT